MAASRNNVRKRGSTWTYYLYVTDGAGERRQQSKGGFATRKEAEAAEPAFRAAARATLETQGEQWTPMRAAIFDALAAEIAGRSPCDPRTLVRAGTQQLAADPGLAGEGDGLLHGAVGGVAVRRRRGGARRCGRGAGDVHAQGVCLESGELLFQRVDELSATNLVAAGDDQFGAEFREGIADFAAKQAGATHHQGGTTLEREQV